VTVEQLNAAYSEACRALAERYNQAKRQLPPTSSDLHGQLERLLAEKLEVVERAYR